MTKKKNDEPVKKNRTKITYGPDCRTIDVNTYDNLDLEAFWSSIKAEGYIRISNEAGDRLLQIIPAKWIVSIALPSEEWEA